LNWTQLCSVILQKDEFKLINNYAPYIANEEKCPKSIKKKKKYVPTYFVK